LYALCIEEVVMASAEAKITTEAALALEIEHYTRILALQPPDGLRAVYLQQLARAHTALRMFPKPHLPDARVSPAEGCLANGKPAKSEDRRG
jgi:hypothetical protein